MLTLMYPRPVDGLWLARAADPNGDLTQGQLVLKALEERGLVAKDVEGVFKIYDMRNRWLITPAGSEAFYIWWRGRMSQPGVRT